MGVILRADLVGLLLHAEVPNFHYSLLHIDLLFREKVELFSQFSELLSESLLSLLSDIILFLVIIFLFLITAFFKCLNFRNKMSDHTLNFRGRQIRFIIASHDYFICPPLFMQTFWLHLEHSQLGVFIFLDGMAHDKGDPAPLLIDPQVIGILHELEDIQEGLAVNQNIGIVVKITNRCHIDFRDCFACFNFQVQS